MAQVKVVWVETCTYEKVLEVDGYDPEEDPSDEESGVMEQILNLDGEAFKEAFLSVDDREVSSVEVLRAGDEFPEITVAAKQHEDMF